MEKSQKVALIEGFGKEVKDAQAVVLTEFRGLKVPEAVDLRKKLGAQGIHFRVIKNTLARRAIEGTPLSTLSDALEGPVAWAYSATDPVAPARALLGLLKDELAEHLKVKAGWLAGRKLAPAEVEALSKLPGKDELRATLLSLFMAAPTRRVGVLSARQSEFLRLLRARAESLPAAGG